MPKPFYDCVRDGGKVKTRDLGDGKYIHICFLNGKSYPGEVKMKKLAGGKKNQIKQNHGKQDE